MTGTSSSSPRNMSPPGLTPVGHLSHVSSGSISDQTPGSQSVATPGSGPTGEFDADPVCMYRGDCQTGSQLRKAISHIFGRNKLCTRMIPTGVWVHYCRKHYQRTRYRNGNEYPQRQIGLVQVQVQRVQSWSDSNVRQNRGPVLKDWSLSVRKREQLRLDSKMTSGTKKRPFYDDGNEGEENFGEKRSETSSTAVPTWLVTMIKDGYSTPQILGIVTRLKDDIDSGRLQQIPDIEILPNIVTDSNNDEPAANNSVKKTYTKRRTTVAPGVGPVNHRRSQSVNTSMLRYDSAPMARRSSQPNNYMAPTAHQFANDYDQLPMEKRQRVDSEGMGMGQHQHHRHQHHHSMSGIPDRYESPMASRTSFGGRVQLAHRPAFAGIRESLAEGHTGGYYPEERGYDNGPDSAFAARESYARQNSGYGIDRRFSAVGGPESQIPLAHGFDAHRDHERDHERHHSTSSAGPNNEPAYGVLPAPNPQRFGGPSVAQQLESSSYVLNSAASRRTGAHQRSVSEAGFLHQAPPPSSFYGRPTSSSSHAAPQLNNLPRLSTNFSEEEPRPSAFSSYQQHQTYGSLGANPATHHAHHAPRSLGHGHSHSMSHTHHHSYNSSNQYNRYNTPSRFGADERRGSLSSQPQQPAALNPSVTSSSTTGNMEKFDNIQLPPLQCVVQTTPSPPQMTVPPAAPALDSSAPSAHLNTGEGIAVQGHSRHQSTSSVAYILGPTVEPGSTSPYVSPPSHATSSSTQNAN
ncbi:hypothetical protein SBRCBS47491_004301 [Sporothrix bragantina]|uniref:ORP1 like protein n=1 Tax=Sporothrix bragantina TaxID=671064 RepID=A0ABP0BNZ7_9PEZI